jgi:hypothetical protein
MIERKRCENEIA